MNEFQMTLHIIDAIILCRQIGSSYENSACGTAYSVRIFVRSATKGMEPIMEIEKKYTIKELPSDLECYPSHLIQQAYLNTDPVIRIRREDDSYYLTYKGKGLLAREEYNLPLTAKAYEHLLPKADGQLISKRRYLIPLKPYTIELDVFHAPFAPLVIAEVEFPTTEEALAFQPPEWFLEDVTMDPAYHNSTLSALKPTGSDGSYLQPKV